MCEILGISFNVPIRPYLSRVAVAMKADRNPDGWGIAYYPDESSQIIKEAMEAGKSRLTESLRNYTELYSKIFIGHVRKSSVGNISHKNTHPFSRELGGREYVFAHNGTLADIETLDTGRFNPIGETDSERAFCHIMHSFEQRNISSWNEDNFYWINEKLFEINKLGKFNCIFSDGEYLFCYNDVNDFKDYCHVKRNPPFELIRLVDQDYNIDIELKDSDAHSGYLIATNPMTDEYWESYLPGQLVVYKDGDIAFQNVFKQEAGV